MHKFSDPADDKFISYLYKNMFITEYEYYENISISSKPI